MGMPKPIPISAAERLGKTYAADQVIIYARKASAENAMLLWSGLCGRYTANYGRRMPDNLTDFALITGVLAS